MSYLATRFAFLTELCGASVQLSPLEGPEMTGGSISGTRVKSVCECVCESLFECVCESLCECL